MPGERAKYSALPRDGIILIAYPNELPGMTYRDIRIHFRCLHFSINCGMISTHQLRKEVEKHDWFRTEKVCP